MKWEFKEGIPIYQQIVLKMQIGIANGTYPPGEKVPAVRDLALEAGVNPNTMQRALSELEREGLLYSQRTSGRFVTENKETLEALRMRLGNAFIAEMFGQLRQLGLNDKQILEAATNWKRQQDGRRHNEDI